MANGAARQRVYEHAAVDFLGFKKRTLMHRMAGLPADFARRRGRRRRLAFDDVAGGRLGRRGRRFPRTSERGFKALDFRALSARLELDFQTVYAAELSSLADLEADGLLRRTATAVEVTRSGVPLLRVIAMRFDPTVTTAALQHSRTI